MAWDKIFEMNSKSTKICPINLFHPNLAVLYIGLFTFTGQSFVLRQHRLQMPDFCSQLFDLHGAVYLTWNIDQQKLAVTQGTKAMIYKPPHPEVQQGPISVEFVCGL